MTTRLPTQDEVLGYHESLSNWGRWGDDDQLGTLNLITPDAKRRGAGAVRHGVSVSCAWEVDASPGGHERSTFWFPCGAEMPGAENTTTPGYHDDSTGGPLVGRSSASASTAGPTPTLTPPCHMFWDVDVQRPSPPTSST